MLSRFQTDSRPIRFREASRSQVVHKAVKKSQEHRTHSIRKKGSSFESLIPSPVKIFWINEVAIKRVDDDDKKHLKEVSIVDLIKPYRSALRFYVFRFYLETCPRTFHSKPDCFNLLVTASQLMKIFTALSTLKVIFAVFFCICFVVNSLISTLNFTLQKINNKPYLWKKTLQE